MNIILFIHKDSLKKGDILKNIIDHKFHGTNLTTLQTFNEFKAKLKEGSGFIEKEIFILLADSKSRLTELTSLIDLLEGKRIILILPDEAKATLSCASQFFPRFFIPLSKTYDDLCSVLNKMINQEKINVNNNGGIKDVSTG
jgi:hypothetical protein